MVDIGKITDMLIDLATSPVATSYYLGGISAASLQAIGAGVDMLTKKFSLLEKAGLKGEYFTPLGSITYWEEIYSQMKITNRQLGLSGELSRNMEDITMSAYDNIIRYGGEIDDLTQAYSAFIEQYGRNMLFSAEELENMAKMRVAFGEGFEEIFVTNQLIGRSIKDTSDFLEVVYRTSDAMGVNVKNTLKNVKQNLSIIDRYSFVRGSRALYEMAMNAERMRISIDKAVSLADNLFDPENSIEIASQLQMLGGEFAKLGDPFELIFMARNQPEELQKRIAGVTAGMAALNRETGEIEIDALSFSQLREFAKITGQDLQELAQASRQIAREGYVQDMLSVDFKTRKDFDMILSKISSIAQYQDGEWQVNLGQEVKSVAELTVADLDEIKAIEIGAEDSYKSLIESNRTLTESIQILTNTILRNLIGDDLYQMADRDLKSTIQNIDDQILDTSGMDFASKALTALQKEAYGNFSNLTKQAVELDMGGALLQLGENIYLPFQQMYDVLSDIDHPFIEELQQTLEPIDKFFDNGKQFFQEGYEFFQKMNGIYDNLKLLNPYRGPFGFGPAGIGEWLRDKMLSSKIESDNEGYGKKKSESSLQFMGRSNTKIETNLNLGFNGKVKLELYGKELELELYKDPQKTNELLSQLKPHFEKIIETQIEQRIHQLSEDARNSANKTTKPLTG